MFKREEKKDRKEKRKTLTSQNHRIPDQIEEQSEEARKSESRKGRRHFSVPGETVSNIVSQPKKAKPEEEDEEEAYANLLPPNAPKKRFCLS